MNSNGQNLLWYKDAVLYEVHVKSFFDGTGDGLGDFRGLTRKLDYLQELGISGIWLQPFYPSPGRDDGYDIADFRDVHPAYGTMEDFQHFVQEAHQRGLRVLAGLVLGHTSDQHPWFQAARAAPPDSSLRDFYVWSDAGPKNQQVLLADWKSSWTWDPVAKASYRHRFFDHLPDLNYRHPLVRQELLNIARFWLSRDVDGLCLEALPCSADPEEASLHSLLREIRCVVEAQFTDRVLLAEVNRWPADVRPYFHDGDECHLALHYSLMPNFLMALRQEDRYPIKEIIRQTPEIPDRCQWALFLRNHDELSLTLVSEEDRDDMYQEYAADPHMRLALGIRRRLAPLLENSRPRIELLNGLLFSLPGTPVLYSGDEIGMGDNVYLGDRQGVRTPMQWTGGKNAGFSAADPARLYNPVIVDPVYGCQAVNVETQQRDPSSLLQWMRRLIDVRKRLPTLGRGALEFLDPQNRKVLAYVRRHEDEVFLAVANLSRHAQPVELDLALFTDRIPVEVLGQTEFPRIGAIPYLLTLAPYGFYWFLLQRRVERIAVRFLPPPIEEVKELPCLTVAGTWETILEDTARDSLEKVLPGYLQSQRWFGGKARAVEAVRIADWTALPACPSLVWLTVLEVVFKDGTADLYFLPLDILTETAAAPPARDLRGRVLARLEGTQGKGLLVDALADSGACQAIQAALAGRLGLATRKGMIRAAPTTAYESLRGPAHIALKVLPGPATSSNSLVRFGNKFLLKVFRRLDVGINPDLEIGRFLTETTAFGAIPKIAGSMEYQRPGAESITLAMLQQLVMNQGDGWHHAIEELGRYFERANARLYEASALDGDGYHWLKLADRDPPPAVLEAIGAYRQVAATLGRRTAELHLALATEKENPEFVPEIITVGDLTAWASEAGTQARKSLLTLEENLELLPEGLRHPARQALDQGPRILKRIDELPHAQVNAAKTRCHGDYHLGQVLRTGSDFVILDFEGEPARPMNQRRAKQSPLKDVAGMLRSFSYAAYAGLFAFTHDRLRDRDRLALWAELWQRWNSAVFLKEYRARAKTAVFLPADAGQFSALLQFFMLDKVFYELAYELNNRPDWVRIPLQGILSLCP